MRSMLITALAAVTIAGAAQAAPQASPDRRAPLPPQASIAFPSHSIRTFHAADRDTLYVQDRRRQWYRADLSGPCLDLPYALAIGFETKGVDRFDRWSTVRVGHERCQVRSLTLSDGPPPKAERRRS